MKPVVYPSDWMFRDPQPPLSDFGRRFLAEGDSWFTIGSLNLPRSSNILFKLEFSSTTAIVNCAYPGDTLQRMVDTFNDPYFDRLLRRKKMDPFWEAILISAGGNDLIDSAQIAPAKKDGTPIPRDERILLTLAEVTRDGRLADPKAFISEEGFTKLAKYLKANFKKLVDRRDQGSSKGRPIFVHTYATPTVRPSGTLGAPRGWLYPALLRYDVPEAHRQALAGELFERLRQSLLELDQDSGNKDALPNLHVFDSASLPNILPAKPNEFKESGDWINEIHLSPNGYEKFSKAFGQWIDERLTRYPMGSNN